MKHKSLFTFFFRCSVATLVFIIFILMIGIAEALPTPDSTTYTLDGFLLADDDSNQFTIIGYDGNEKTIRIPSHFEGKPIVAIGNSAFAHCDSFVEVSVPDSVKSIGDQAFIWCKNLKSLSLPEGLEYIGTGAFDYCHELECASLPNSVVSAEPAFSDCAKMIKRLPNYEIIVFENDACILKSYHGVDEVVTVPDKLEGKTVVGIGQYAFMGNKQIKEIHMPDSIRTIGDSAFYQCMNLEIITLPKNLITLDNNAFYYCWKVENIILPQGLKTIGVGAFSQMEALKEISIPSSVIKIGADAFRFCKALQNVEIPDSISRLEDGTFGDCYSLNKITLPPTVTSLGSDVFFWCSNLCEIWGEPNSFAESYAKESNLVFISTLDADPQTAQNAPAKVYPAGTRVIGDYKVSAYEDGTCGIIDYYGENKELVIPEYIGDYKVTEICSSNQFDRYYGVTSIFIPEGVTCIGKWAFIGCDFSEISIPNSATLIEPDFLDLCDDVETVHISPEHPSLKYEQDCLIDKRDNTLILFCGKQSSFTIPNGITAIGEDAFYNKVNLEHVKIPSSVKTIHQFAFSFCTNLKSVRIEEGVLSIGFHAFSSCYALTDINLPSSLIEIENEAFLVCESLEEIKTPTGVLRDDELEKMKEFPPYWGFNRIYIKSPNTLDVYSGPGKEYHRNADGKALLATSDEVYCAGREGDWLMIAYESNAGIPKIGYVQNPISAADFEFSELEFEYQETVVAQDCELKDTPYATGNCIKALPPNHAATYLESYIEDDRGTMKWVYIETSIDSKKVRGYIPYEAIHIPETKE